MVFKLIRSVLGIESSDSSSETDVTVEREPDDAAATGTEASASTGSMTEEPPGEGAAEPAEAAGAASTSDDAGDAEPDAETPDDAAAAGTEASASTGSMTEEPPEEGATEPAEAAGPTSEPVDDEPVDDETTDDGDEATVPVEEVSGIGPAYAERLGEAGVESVADLLDADPEALADSTGISAKRIGRWQDRAEDA